MKKVYLQDVQSVALRLVIDRENEINNFKPEEYWTIEGLFKHKQKRFLLNLHEKSKPVKLKMKVMLKNHNTIRWGQI